MKKRNLLIKNEELVIENEKLKKEKERLLLVVKATNECIKMNLKKIEELELIIKSIKTE